MRQPLDYYGCFRAHPTTGGEDYNYSVKEPRSTSLTRSPYTHASSLLRTFGRGRGETWADSLMRGDKTPLYQRMRCGYRSRIPSGFTRRSGRHGHQDQCWLTDSERFHQLGAAMVAPPPHHDGAPSCTTRGSRGGIIVSHVDESRQATACKIMGMVNSEPCRGLSKLRHRESYL